MATFGYFGRTRRNQNDIYNEVNSTFYPCAVAQAVSHRLLTEDTRLHTQGSPSLISGGQSGSGTSFSPNPSVFCCYYHFISAP